MEVGHFRGCGWCLFSKNSVKPQTCLGGFLAALNSCHQLPGSLKEAWVVLLCRLKIMFYSPKAWSLSHSSLSWLYTVN